MPTEDQRSDRSSQGVPQGLLADALMPSLKILAPTVGVALLVWGLLLAYLSSPAYADTTFTVNSTGDQNDVDFPFGTFDGSSDAKCDVDSTLDDDQCTLRAAIQEANVTAGDDTIDIRVTGTVNLTEVLPDLSTSMNIDGPGDDQLTVRRRVGGNYRIFTVSGATTVVTISGMTISHGNVVDGEGGGILIADSATLTVADSTITNNFTEDGGGGIGIDSDTNGTLTVTGSTITGNTGEFDNGGGIRNDGNGTVTVTDSTISDNFSGHEGGALANDGDGTMEVTGSTIGPANFSDSEGGGIYNNRGTLTVTGSTIRGNSTRSDGGGIFNGGTLKVTDSTISGNTSGPSSFGGEGGGIYSSTELPDTTTITNSTISGNTAAGERGIGGGVYNSFGLTVIKNSTITKNFAPEGRGSGVASQGSEEFASAETEVLSSIISENTNTDVDFLTGFGTPTNTFLSSGYNLIGDGNATGAFNQSGDQTGVDDPGLGDLADNGGPTQTHTLLTGSPAIDKGSTDLATDQRGESRPHDFPDIANATDGDGSDIGSFELQSQPALSINDITLSEGNSGTTNATFTVSLTQASSQPVTVNYATADGTATAGTDYQSTSGTLIFAPGQTTQSVRVQVNGENVFEENESFFVNLSNPTNATISDAQGEGTITNDDPAPDTTAPTVISTFPRDGGEVGPAANIRATFSEDMQEASVINAFKLFRKGSTNQIAATVTYDAATDIATLNPTNNLRRGVTYKAVVSTVAKDVAGNGLDQNSSTAGLQQKVWFFEID